MTAMTMIKQQLSAAAMSFLDKKAKRIKELSIQWGRNAIEIGEELRQARDKFPVKGSNHRPGWHDWIGKNTDWGVRQTESFIQIAAKFGRNGVSTGISYKVFLYLARNTVPDKASDEVIKRARTGERIGLGKAREIVAAHLPTRSQAIKEAKETGRLVPARDGHSYSGIDDEQASAYSERRHSVYSIKEAIQLIASCHLTPTQWIKQAEDRWLTDLSLGSVETATKWLDKLSPALAERLKVLQ